MVTTRVQRFLKAYRKTGQVAPAARAAKIDRGAHYKRLRRDPQYRAAFREAQEDAADAIEDKCLAWAFEGYEEPVIYQGALCFPPDAWEPDPENPGKKRLKPNAKPLTRRRRSEALAILALRGAKPEKYMRREMPPAAPADGLQTWEEFLLVYRRSATDAAPPPDAR